jgi:hypothetical protein
MSLRETTPALIRTFWPVCLIPSNARQEGEPAICLLKAFNTEETNQKFRQRSAKVPSSNRWIITQPTPCLLRLRASKGVLSRENVNSSAVSGNTMRGAARISGARARVSCRPRLRAHPRLRYRRSQPCAMRSPFPANAWQRAVLSRATLALAFSGAALV